MNKRLPRSVITRIRALIRIRETATHHGQSYLYFIAPNLLSNIFHSLWKWLIYQIILNDENFACHAVIRHGPGTQRTHRLGHGNVPPSLFFLHTDQMRHCPVDEENLWNSIQSTVSFRKPIWPSPW